MSAVPSGSRAAVARVLSILFPLVALVALVLIGRRARVAPAEAAALASVASVAPSAEPSSVVASADAGVAAPSASSSTADAGAAPDAAAITTLADGAVVVDLNLATEAELRKLPRIGPSRARAILELRARLGRFKSVNDLARIKGIGRSTLKRLRPLTRVGQ